MSGTVSMVDIYDAKTGKYLLYPGAPLAKDLRVSDLARVGVIDSGVAKSHPQIAGLIVAEKDWTGEGIEDLSGHGTAVALGILHADSMESLSMMENTVPGLLVAKVKPQKKLIPLNAVVEAIHWLASQKADVINMSLGFPGDPEKLGKLKQAIQAYPDILFIAAAGNFGPYKTVYPAGFKLPNIVSVGDGTDFSGKAEIHVPPILKPVPEEQYAQSLQFREFEHGIKLARGEGGEEARKIFLRITQTPKHVAAADAWHQLALYEVQHGRYEPAVEMLTRAVELAAGTPRKQAAFFAVLGAVHFNNKAFAAAEPAYRRSVELDGSVSANVYQLGIIYLRMEKFHKALQQFEATALLDPKFPELQEILSTLRAAAKAGRLPPE